MKESEYEDPFEFLETQSDNGDLLSLHGENDPFDVSLWTQ